MSVPYDRLTSDDAALLMVDHQTGLSNGVADQSLPEFMNNVTALAKLAQLFKLPTVITTSAADGPNGPLLPQILALLREVPVVHRPGEINAWQNNDFVAAVKRTGRKKLLIAGVSTEEWDVGRLDFLVARRRHLEGRGQVGPQLEPVHLSDRVALGHLLVDDPPTGRHH